jgi:rhamnose transport system ATP-binding protein
VNQAEPRPATLGEGQAPVVPVLEGRHLSMTFPGVRALRDVDFAILPGEVHALTGENGAGKSTLIKVLAGELSDYTGEVFLDGHLVRFASPRQAMHAGIAVIPQELQLVSGLSADENILLGREPRNRWGIVDRSKLRHDARVYLDRLGEAGLPAGPVGNLEAGQRQLVAIARALSLDARLIIMDEPTSSLGPPEIERLERVVLDLASHGVAIVYVSHRLGEVRRLARRVTVLRDGQLVATRSADGLEERDIVRLMVGRGIHKGELTPLPADAPDLLRVDCLSVPDPGRPGGFRLRDVSLTVRRGEIVGLAGLMGAGRTDLLLTLTGAIDRPRSGRVWMGGRESAPRSPADARREGMMLLPEDRKVHGILAHQSVKANITLSALDRVSRYGFISSSREREAVAGLMRQTGVRAASADVPIDTLSGGNQQKAILARCLFASPSLLLLDEPTRGVDLAARADLYEVIRGLAANGYGILLCSSELEELLTLCHRIVVFREGRVSATFDHGDATEEVIMAAATAAPPSGEGTGQDGGKGNGASPPPAAPVLPRVVRRPAWTHMASLWGLAAVLLLAIVASPVRGGRLIFLDLGNLTDILRQVAEKGILAAGMTPVIIAGGIDLSVGSVLALSATSVALLLMHGHLDVWMAVLTALVIGAGVGFVNGFVVARWRIQAFIATLATMSAARGVARYISGGAAVPLGFGAGGAPEAFQRLAAPVIPFVPAPAVLFLLSVAVVYVLMARMRSGRYIHAIGDNEQAARLSGLNIFSHKILVYVLCGALAALAGVIHCAQLEQGNPNDGVSYELDAIAAVVIGGTSLSGGVGTVGGTLIGTLIIGIINNCMGLNNIDANLQLILKGAIILGAVWLQRRQR